MLLSVCLSVCLSHLILLFNWNNLKTLDATDSKLLLVYRNDGSTQDSQLD